MDIVIDTREQLPLFKGIRFGLRVGDYTTRVLLNSYCIERKSLQDLCGTMCQGNRRFHNELIRAKANGIKLVMVVEGTRQNFLKKNFPGGPARKVSGETLCKIIATFERKHHLKVYWCTSRLAAKKLMLKLFAEQELFLTSKRPNRILNNRPKVSAKCQADKRKNK